MVRRAIWMFFAPSLIVILIVEPDAVIESRTIPAILLIFLFDIDILMSTPSIQKTDARQK